MLKRGDSSGRKAAAHAPAIVRSILILGGTIEARNLAERLAGDERFRTTYSLAGITRFPVTVDGTDVRKGGFNGEQGFRDYLVSSGTDVVVDATHPFAERMTETASRVSRDLRLPHIVVQRPPWALGPGDDWHPVAAAEDLAQLVPKDATVFLATGRNRAGTLASILPGRRLLCRVIDLPDQPFPASNGKWIAGRPPFSVESEVELFRSEGIDWLVTRNSGGRMAESKLEAARILGLPVAMLGRPPLPNCTVVESVEACLEWLSTIGFEGTAATESPMGPAGKRKSR